MPRAMQAQTSVAVSSGPIRKSGPGRRGFADVLAVDSPGTTVTAFAGPAASLICSPGRAEVTYESSHVRLSSWAIEA